MRVLQRLGAHARRTEGDVVPVVVRPATVLENPPFAEEVVVERRPAEGCEDREEGDVELELLKSVGDAHDVVHALIVEAADEPRHHADAPVVQLGHRVLVRVDLVLALVHALERLGVERLDAQEDARTSARLHPIEELGVLHDVDGGLGEPVAVQTHHGSEQLFGPAALHEQVVIPEPRDLLTEASGEP